MDNTHKKPTRIMDFAPAKRRPARAAASAPAAAPQPVHPQAAAPRQMTQTAQTAQTAQITQSAQAASHTQPQTILPTQPQSRPTRLRSRPSAPSRPAAIFKRPSPAATDPLSARPLSRSATASRPLAPSQPAAPRIIQSTTVKSIAATDDHVESFEFGIIEDLSPVVAPEPPMIPGSRPSAAAQPQPTRPAAAPARARASARPQMSTRSASAQVQARPIRPASRTKAQEPLQGHSHLDTSGQLAAIATEEQQSKHHSPDKPARFSRKGKSNNDSAPRKSPFLSSVSVPKRPLSASAPTGIHAPTTSSAAPAKPAEHPRKKRKSIPFLVIVILSVLLGVSLGAIVYFVLPH